MIRHARTVTRRALSGRHLPVLAVIVLSLATMGGRCGDNGSDSRLADWQLVWQDEFEGPAGQSPDPARWRFDIGTDWGNAQLEYDTERPVNVSLDGAGHLAITAREESYQGQAYTSGRINTYQFFAQARGRFEARIRLPVGQGIWPAFWLLGADFDTVGWPECGEIDIMEYRGQEPRILHGSIHGPGYSGGSAVTGRFELPGSAGLDADFHVFAVEWYGDRITWILDDIRYLTITPSDLPPGARWVFDHPFFVILNVAVGGNFVGPPNASTSFPQTMLVDWVRVFRSGP
ncbi:MAG: glycoside hydrolase family 16 protein [Candidatus Krumholzibacteria bacterium]|nr:glycoside hydrolase family 16 protein [Candidatus Krumholzibacteria bacterium]